MDFCIWCQTGWCLVLPLPGPGLHTCGGKKRPTHKGTQQEGASGKEDPLESSTGVGLPAAGASGRVGGTQPHSPGVGLAAGAGGGGVLEVPFLTGHAVVSRLLNFAWQERGQASQGEWAKGVSCPAVSFLCAHGTAPPCTPSPFCIWYLSSSPPCSASPGLRGPSTPSLPLSQFHFSAYRSLL